MSKAKRKGRIFIDYLRNQRGSTAIMPSSVRAREHAPVAAPIGWDALADAESAGHWTIRDADALLERAGSPELKGWAFARQKPPSIRLGIGHGSSSTYNTIPNARKGPPRMGTTLKKPQ